MLCKRCSMAQAAEGSLAWTYVCDSEMLMALAVMRVRQEAVRTAKVLAGVKCISRTPANSNGKASGVRWTRCQKDKSRDSQVDLR